MFLASCQKDWRKDESGVMGACNGVQVFKIEAAGIYIHILVEVKLKVIEGWKNKLARCSREVWRWK